MLRALEPELMDQPGLDPREHIRALDGLGRINLVSRSVAPIWQCVERAARQLAGRPLRVLDLACGGGHVGIALARRARRSGRRVHLHGCDVSPVALTYARRLAETHHVEASFETLDVVRDPLPGGFDVVLASLFLHHLGEEDAAFMLRSMAAAAGSMVVVSDLRRTWLGGLFAWVGCRILSRSPVVRVDGGRSVRAAFTVAEVRGLADRAGLAAARISVHWPQRWMLVWLRPESLVSCDPSRQSPGARPGMPSLASGCAPRAE
jgi:2-polyprenyl-3-methyl-5-hydroxy-6-metoxy-1,4-benzoquinol methylase